MSILLKIPNGLCKIFTKTPSEVAGADGVNTDIGFKKKEQIVIFRGEKLRKKNSFPMAIGNGLYLVEPH